MRKMSDTIARLTALRAQQNVHAPTLGSSNRLSTLTGFGSNPGALQARFYLPEALPENAPLVVVLHGCTQNAAAYDHGSGWTKLADQAGFAVLFPEQQRANNPNLCFNWFVPADTNRDGGEALSIRQMIETLIAAHGLDRERLFVTGLSAGGAMASVMLATYPEVFAGGAIIAGLAYGTANTIPEAFDRMRGHGGPSEPELQRLVSIASPHKGPWPRISIWQGSADQTVAASNAEAIAGQWRGVHRLGKTPTRSETVDGHTRRTWIDASGNALVETYTIPGMGHGTPLRTAGEHGLGVAGPFMLDVGISSTRRIAEFWGIAEPRASAPAKPRQPRRRDAQLPASPHRFALADDARVTARTAPLRDPAPSTPAADEKGVRKIIEDALRAAGLMQ
ncbi:extracellular catalytic domain type 1 short-chain-length polyhydroxyalkanoate depolymerase [Mesorhizobium sp. ASY16-5R]|uniref:extracellular catalytic domain type 1 short-chain-length polyhydroxyalkanoate depolymerase n=1 Tax=Mesorhizobium sp. ASY16-5R TaxID=3445772 RepID=UPI003FA023D0